MTDELCYSSQYNYIITKLHLSAHRLTNICHWAQNHLCGSYFSSRCLLDPTLPLWHIHEYMHLYIDSAVKAEHSLFG